MQCDLHAVSDAEGRLHLRLGTNGADWLHYVWSGQQVWLCTADGRRRVSVRLALKLLLREVWLRELWLRDLAATEQDDDALDLALGIALKPEPTRTASMTELLS